MLHYLDSGAERNAQFAYRLDIMPLIKQEVIARNIGDVAHLAPDIALEIADSKLRVEETLEVVRSELSSSLGIPNKLFTNTRSLERVSELGRYPINSNFVLDDGSSVRKGILDENTVNLASIMRAVSTDVLDVVYADNHTHLKSMLPNRKGQIIIDQSQFVDHKKYLTLNKENKRVNDHVNWINSIIDRFALQKIDGRSILGRLNDLFCRCTSAFKVLSHLKPTMLVTNANYSATVLAHVLAARLLNIPSIAFQHTLSAYGKNGAFSPSLLPFKFQDAITDLMPDYHCVADNFTRDIMLGSNATNQNSIFVNPYYFVETTLPNQKTQTKPGQLNFQREYFFDLRKRKKILVVDLADTGLLCSVLSEIFNSFEEYHVVILNSTEQTIWSNHVSEHLATKGRINFEIVNKNLTNLRSLNGFCDLIISDCFSSLPLLETTKTCIIYFENENKGRRDIELVEMLKNNKDQFFCLDRSSGFPPVDHFDVSKFKERETTYFSIKDIIENASKMKQDMNILTPQHKERFDGITSLIS